MPPASYQDNLVQKHGFVSMVALVYMAHDPLRPDSDASLEIGPLWGIKEISGDVKPPPASKHGERAPTSTGRYHTCPTFRLRMRGRT